MAVIDPGLQLSDHLFQSGAQRVIHRFREDIRAWRHEMSSDPKGGTRLEPMLHEDTGLVDLERLAQRFETLPDQRGEGSRGLMVAVSKDELHDGPSIASSSGFDKDTY